MCLINSMRIVVLASPSVRRLYALDDLHYTVLEILLLHSSMHLTTFITLFGRYYSLPFEISSAPEFLHERHAVGSRRRLVPDT